MTDELRQVLDDVQQGRIRTTQTVTNQEGKNIDPLYWTLAVTRGQIKLASVGLIPYRGWKLSTIKKTFHITGKSAKQVHENFIKLIFEPYKEYLKS